MSVRIIVVMVFLVLSSVVGICHAASAVNLSTSTGQQEVLPGQPVRIHFGDYVIEMNSEQTKTGELPNVPGVGNEKRLYGSLRRLSYKLVKGKAQDVSEKIETLSSNVKGMPKAYDKSAEVRFKNWGDNFVLADEVPLPENSFWEVRQNLFLDGQRFAQFRIRFTPNSIRIFWEPIAPDTATTLLVSAR